MPSHKTNLQSTVESIFLMLVILTISVVGFWLESIGDFLVVLFTIYLLVQLGFAVLGFVVGTIQGIITGQWQKLHRALKIFLGNFYLNENQSFLSAFAEGLSRHIWEFPQTLVGHIWAQCLNSLGLIQRVEYFEGVTFSITINRRKRSGMSLGSFIYITIDDTIKSDFRECLLADPLFMHEYGHSFDSRLYGIFYLPFIGLPSLISAARSKQMIGNGEELGQHKYMSYDMRANRKAAKHFWQAYETEWEPFSRDYPRSKSDC
jgi:hypothetical protein